MLKRALLGLALLCVGVCARAGTGSASSGFNPDLTGSGLFTTVVSSPSVQSIYAPTKYYALQVAPTGAVTSWDVRLEGSLDNSNWTQILQHTNITPGSNTIVFSGANVSPSLYVRVRITGLILGTGTSITVAFVAAP